MKTNLFRVAVLGMLMSFSNMVVADTIEIAPTFARRILSLTPNATELSPMAVYNDGGGNVQRSLLYFDLSGIPTGATVTDATLTMTHDSAIFFGGQPNGVSTDIYRIATGWDPWNVTWNASFVGVPWANAGGDFAGKNGSPYASNTDLIPDNSGLVAMHWNVSTLVSEWTSGASANYGFMVTGSAGNQLHFYSVGNGSSSPTLAVTYAVPEPSTVILLCCGAAGLIGYVSRRR